MSGLASAVSQEKLRSTCNQCTLSKVRCNKRKPTCQRCQTHNFRCVYDRSRRRGKPRSGQQQRSLDGSSTSYPAQSELCNWPNAYNNESMDPLAELTRLLPGDDMVDYSLWADADAMLSSASSDITREGSRSDTSVRMTFAPLDRPCQGETCTSTVFCTLGTLYSMGAATGSRVHTIQDAKQLFSGLILQTVRTTMGRLQTLLKNDCSYCAQQVDLGILLSAVVSKMLTWYRTILDTMSDLSAKHASAPRESVSRSSIMVGDFQLDSTMETRMKAQLLLWELEEMSLLLKLLSERNSRASAGGDVYSSLGKRLRASLAELTSEINALMVRGKASGC